ncbi:hypothetical protein PV10_04464 [Exophiala mesophila]|uniref:F-box domain-containing protein n=1 Tax=Exophiala mesophila TaxID=212818 RepID=A0A0D1WV76_EXOME|nr:uncharacterized protein PV10_04464 [Exophiala mesophila]KIV93235.1 hypothetical protein PV10_04464 [Exophiala mesophila]
MPLQSHEVLTLRLILDCDEDSEPDGHGHGHRQLGLDRLSLTSSVNPADSRPLFLRLPVEIRLKIFRYLLRLDRNRKSHTRRPPPESVIDLLWIHSRRILDAPPFKHKGNQEINGCPPVLHTCPLHPAIMKTCKQLYLEGKEVLYAENKVVALQSGIRGLVAKFRNYGIPAYGPLQVSRLWKNDMDGTPGSLAMFDPVMLFSGTKTKASASFYVCSYKDTADFIHALWIMIRCPFARGMKYNLSISAEQTNRYIHRTDSFVKYAVLPWLHQDIAKLDFHNQSAPQPESLGTSSKLPTISARLASLRDEKTKHTDGHEKDPSLYSYNQICAYLEQVFLQAENCVGQGKFISAELLFERVHYEACSIIRTRTAKLVDVSANSQEGINRVCKLIAISAYRLCELRSGSLAQMIARNIEKAREKQKKDENISDDETSQESSDETGRSRPAETSVSVASDALDRKRCNKKVGPSIEPLNTDLSQYTTSRNESRPPIMPRTTRLDPGPARDLAISNGLLALRLPCACPLHEWCIRVDIMLLRLFAERHDFKYAGWAISRIKENFNLVWKDAKAKNKTGEKYQALGELVVELERIGKIVSDKTNCFKAAESSQNMVTTLWGERLIPKKSYVGLIWTFRWA